MKLRRKLDEYNPSLDFFKQLLLKEYCLSNKIEVHMILHGRVKNNLYEKHRVENLVLINIYLNTFL